MGWLTFTEVFGKHRRNLLSPETVKSEFTAAMSNDNDSGEPAELPPDRTNIAQQNVYRFEPDMRGLFESIWFKRYAS